MSKLGPWGVILRWSALAEHSMGSFSMILNTLIYELERLADEAEVLMDDALEVLDNVIDAAFFLGKLCSISLNRQKWWTLI
jgi:hypothetical protein